MEKLLFKKGRKGIGGSFLATLNPSLWSVAERSKEGFKNCKEHIGLKIKCKFESGLRNRKCKLFSGRVN